MTVRLHLDVAAWRAHLQARAAQLPGIVPVAKGNGYGFGLGVLAAEAARLEAFTQVLAVGTAREVAAVRAPGRDVTGEPSTGWQHDIVVLTPWSPRDPVATSLLSDPQVITTIGHADDLGRVADLAPGARVLLEVRTSMHRHGLDVAELPAAVGRLDGPRCEGWTIHLPLAAVDRLGEARTLSRAALAALPGPIWLSHLDDADYLTLRAELAREGVEARIRVGTSLWLGVPGSRRMTGEVLDVHPVRSGDRVGYWQRRIPRDGVVVVVSGGTAHGVALTAPTSARSAKQRLRTVIGGSLEAAGFARSPYTVDGRKRFFVEPPHMQSSLIFVPGTPTLAIGDEVPVELRLTTANVDLIVPD